MSPVTASRVALDQLERARAERTRQSLVLATRQVIASGGRLSGPAVAGQAGLSTASFYGYFASKYGALVAAADQVSAELNARIAAVLSVERLLDVGLGRLSRELLDAVTATLRENAAVIRLARARLAEDSELRAVFRERERECLAGLRRFIALGAAAGRIRDGDHPAMAAALLVTIQGYDNPVLLKLDDGDAAIGHLASMVDALLAP